MDGTQIKIPLTELREALKDKKNKDLKELVKKCLQQMADIYRTPVDHVQHLLDDIVDKVKQESKKFDSRLPYPPSTANNMSIQIEMPTRGKVGVVEFNSVIKV